MQQTWKTVWTCVPFTFIMFIHFYFLTFRTTYSCIFLDSFLAPPLAWRPRQPPSLPKYTGGTKGVRKGVGLNPSPWAWYFTKTELSTTWSPATYVKENHQRLHSGVCFATLNHNLLSRVLDYKGMCCHHSTS